MTTGTTNDEDPHTGRPRSADDVPRMRASDAERTATVDVLKDAVTHGLLDPDEGSERMASAFAARYRDELPAITADLPPLQVVPAAAGWRSLSADVLAQLRHEVQVTRAAGVRSRRFLVTVLVAVLLAAVVLGVLVTLGGLVAHGPHAGGPFDGGPIDGGAFQRGHGH